MTGAELRARREALRLSTRGLAALLDVSHNTIWRWEQEQMPIEHPAMLRRALDQIEGERAQEKA